MFDTIAGLPVHPLAVHAVVVLLPLMALVTIAVSVRPSWRQYSLWVLVANVGVFVAAFVAKESGEALYHRIGQFGRNDLAEKHVEYGDMLPVFAFGLVIAALAVYLLRRTSKLAVIGILLSIVAGVAAVGWTTVTGDSGARAVWEDTIKNTTAP